MAHPVLEEIQMELSWAPYHLLDYGFHQERRAQLEDMKPADDWKARATKANYDIEH